MSSPPPATNISRKSEKGVSLVTGTDGQTAWIRARQEQGKDSRGIGVCDLYIGDHMFNPENHDHLRRMVADALRFAIERARDVGYAQAQEDIRTALGVSR